MRFQKIILNIFIYLSKFSKKIDNYCNKWNLLGYASSYILIVNFIFQRIFRINADVDFSVNFTSSVKGYQNIILHKDKNTITSFVASGGFYIQAENQIILGKNILFAPGIKIISSNHDPKNLKENIKGEGIKIGDNVWIGTNAIILPGVTIGNNCIIGAGAIVTKSFGNNLVIGGNPAKILKDNI